MIKTYTATGGAVLCIADENGNVSVINCSPDSTVTVTPLRGAPDPETVYNGQSANDAGAAVVLKLQDDGVPY